MKIVHKISILFFLPLFFLACVARKAKPITEYSQRDAKKGLLLDVRTPEEYEAGHLRGAINLNWFAADFVSHADTLQRGKTIFVYCRSGKRSAKAAKVLDSLGYSVVDLLGGYEAYDGHKKPSLEQ